MNIEVEIVDNNFVLMWPLIGRKASAPRSLTLWHENGIKREHDNHEWKWNSFLKLATKKK